MKVKNNLDIFVEDLCCLGKLGFTKYNGPIKIFQLSYAGDNASHVIQVLHVKKLTENVLTRTSAQNSKKRESLVMIVCVL